MPYDDFIHNKLMTNEEILQIAREHLEEFDTDNGADCAWSDFAATREKLIEFAQAVRKETLNEILSILKNVPNPEANRTAINCIMDNINAEVVCGNVEPIVVSGDVGG